MVLIALYYINKDTEETVATKVVSFCGRDCLFDLIQGLIVCRVLNKGKSCVHIASSVFLPVRISDFNLLVPEVSVLQPQLLKHPGAIHCSIE